MPLLLSSTILLFSKSLSSCSSRAHGGALGLVRSISKSQTIICQRRFSWVFLFPTSAQKFLPDHFHAHPGNPSCPPLLLGLGASSGGGVGAAFLLLTGDPGRLPPCESKVLWTDKTSWLVHHPLGGLPVWRHCRLDDPEEGLGNQDNRIRYELKNNEKKTLFYSIPTCSCLNKYRLAQSSWVSLRYKARTKRMKLEFGQDEVRMWSRCNQSYSVMPSTSSQLLPAIQVEAVLCPVLVLRVPGQMWIFFDKEQFLKIANMTKDKLQMLPESDQKRTKIIIICFLFDLKIRTSHHHQGLRYCNVSNVW